jgi:hypothetical protein
MPLRQLYRKQVSGNGESTQPQIISRRLNYFQITKKFIFNLKNIFLGFLGENYGFLHCEKAIRILKRHCSICGIFYPQEEVFFKT